MQELALFIDSLDLEKIMFWVRSAGPFEVSGFGKVRKRDFGFEAFHPILLEQKNSVGNTEISANALGRAMYELRDVPGDLNFWWHSHGDGFCYFSDTDRKYLHEFAETNYVVATVFNRMGEHRSCYYQATPHRFFVDDLKLHSQHWVDNETKKTWQSEYVAKTENFEWKKKGKKYRKTLVPHAALAHETAHEAARDQTPDESAIEATHG